MAKEKYNEEDGVWRTIGGRKVFIRKGQSVADAMIESGKFKGQKNKPGMRESYRQEKEKDYKEQEELYDKYKKANEESSNVQKEAHEYMKKVTDNNEKYEDTYEKRKEREDRQEQVDKERGKAEPLRENHRERIEKQAEEEERRNLFSEAYDKLDKKDYNDLVERSSREEISNEEVRAILKHNERVKGQAEEEKRIKEQLDKERESWTDDDYAKRNRDIQDMKKKAQETFEKALEESRMSGNDKLEESARRSREETLRDIDKLEKENRANYDEYRKNKKTTNETMNNAIREKASKKKEVEEDLPKHTEIKSQGTSNRKEVSENIQAHILDYYDSPDDFVKQMENMNAPTMWRAGEELASGGSYMIYYDEQREFLDSLKINPKGKEFSDDRVFDTYKSLIGRESAKLYERIKRNQYKQYKKDHPLTQMTFEDFKDMKK